MLIRVTNISLKTLDFRIESRVFIQWGQGTSGAMILTRPWPQTLKHPLILALAVIAHLGKVKDIFDAAGKLGLFYLPFFARVFAHLARCAAANSFATGC